MIANLSGFIMQNYQSHLEKLRTDAAECALIRDLATDVVKRAIFDRLAYHMNLLADQIERDTVARKTVRSGLRR
jgi:hypothetical protein